jgi:hypothetical protein
VAKLKVRTDPDGALADMRLAHASPGFEQMPDELRRDVLLLLGGIGWQDDPSAALELLRRAEVIQPDQNNAAFYRLLSQIGYTADRPDVVLGAMKQLVFRFPDQVSQLEGRDIQRAIHQAKAAAGSEEDRTLILERLWEVGYEPPEPYFKPDGLWFELLLLYIEGGND